jgi:hypothetical protein
MFLMPKGLYIFGALTHIYIVNAHLFVISLVVGFFNCDMK